MLNLSSLELELLWSDTQLIEASGFGCGGRVQNQEHKVASSKKATDDNFVIRHNDNTLFFIRFGTVQTITLRLFVMLLDHFWIHEAAMHMHMQ